MTSMLLLLIRYWRVLVFLASLDKVAQKAFDHIHEVRDRERIQLYEIANARFLLGVRDLHTQHPSEYHPRQSVLQ